MSTELVCLFSNDFTLIRVNKSWSTFFGFTEDTVVGRNLFEFIPETHHSQVRSDLLVLGPQQRSTSRIHSAGFATHIIAWIDWSYRAILDERDEIIAYEAVGHLAPARSRPDQLPCSAFTDVPSHHSFKH